MKEANNNSINIVAQAFYGNRVATEIDRNNVDRFILGYVDNNIEVSEPINRSVIFVPDANGIVIIYNKYEEEKRRQSIKEDGYTVKPLVIIPEEDIEIYSRCIVCRMSANEELESLQSEDFEKFMKYLAE